MLRDNCDEFIYYEDLDRPPVVAIDSDGRVPEPKRKLYALLIDSLLALKRENKEVIFSSMVKDTMKRKKPSFNEEYHGYRTFSELLEDAARHGVVEIEKHKASGTYVVTRFGSELQGGAQLLPAVPARQLALPPERPERPPERAERAERPGRSERPAPAPEREPAEPPRKVVSLPGQPASRPAAPVEREREREPERVSARQPEPRRAPPPPVAEPDDGDEDDGRPVLGRSLLDELDDLDAIPSYRPQAIRSKSDIPTSRPPQPRETRPAAARPAAPPVPPPPARRPTETNGEPPARRARAEKPERPPEPRRERAEPRLERDEARDEPRQSRRQPPAREAPARAPAPRRPAPPADDFSSGLDLD